MPPTTLTLPSELVLAMPIGQQAMGKPVRVVQEWLGLNNFNVKIDGDFGPATGQAVQAFQRTQGLPVTGTVDQATMDALSAPMQRALQRVPAAGDLGTLVVAYASQHLAQGPREIGGANCGPWVRLYMDGNEGSAWPWCAGFATFVLRQAAAHAGVSLPLMRTFSCDSLAADAQAKHRLVQDAQLGDQNPAALLRPGSLFLVRRTPGDWVHTGILTAAHGETFETIEGNTNDTGDREGYEVCKRFRAYRSVDFALLA